MIWITGDTHGDFSGRFSADAFPEQKEMTKDDYVIILGDFGGVWNKNREDGYEKNWLDWFDSRNFTLLFIDGNHENYDRLLHDYPEKEWHGGKVHEIRHSVLHLKRGHIFDINGLSFFTFGGARSHDIDGGILEPDAPDFREKKKRLDKDPCGIPYRINHVSWWKEEMPSEYEMRFGMGNLAKHGNKVDFILTHNCPASTLMLYGHTFACDDLNRYFERVKTSVTFKKWFFGHYHDNRQIGMQEIMLYEQFVRIQ